MLLTTRSPLAGNLESSSDLELLRVKRRGWSTLPASTDCLPHVMCNLTRHSSRYAHMINVCMACTITMLSKKCELTISLLPWMNRHPPSAKVMYGIPASLMRCFNKTTTRPSP
eukprot:2714264-Rhodomonas_salina.1